MEFIESNFINTTTQISVTSNTITIENLLNKDLFYQYASDGFNNDATTSSIVFAFDSTLNVSRISLMEHNLKSYTIFYNGVTANTFQLTSTAGTTASNFITNSETSQYLIINTQPVSKITIDMKSTMVADSEKAIGYFLVSNLKMDFSRIPSSKNFKPQIVPKQIIHTLSDGGQRIQNIRDKRSWDIKFQYIDSSLQAQLFSVWDSHNPFWFVPFGTSTGWDKQLAEVIWSGPFQFYEFSDDAAPSGFSGKINIDETPNDV